MCVNNAENRRNFDKFEDGRNKFAKGNNVSKGKRKRTQTDKLLAALKKEGKKRGEKWWDKVAEKAFVDKDIMKAIVNKLVPTVSELTGVGGESLTFIIEKTYENKSKTDPETN